MRKITLFLAFTFGISQIVSAQLQTVDEEGNIQAAYLKKLNKKAKYGATLISKELSFGTGKGMNGMPVVIAEEQGQVEMVSIENRTSVGYVLPYNQFVKLRDYDFYVYYKTGFKSQKYPPAKISLTDESIFMDDNYGMLYGFEAAESGQRCRFKYDYQYTDAKYLTRFFFHEGFPVRETSISFKVPSWLEIDIKEMNFGNYKIRKEVKKDKNLTIYSYTVDNLPAIHQEPASLARPFYLPHLVITVKTFVVDQQKYNGFKSLDDLYAWYNYLYKKAENNPESIKSQVNTLIQNKKTDEEKIKALYYWVQDNIRYVAFEEGYSGFVPQTVQEVYQNKYGDCKGMANLLTEMLKIAGYDAHFSWIGTREIPYDCTEIQSMCVDNHAICVLYLKGKTYFLDGTEKYAALGRNAYRIQGKKVLVQNGDSYKVEQVPLPIVEENQIMTQAQLHLKGDKIVGHVSVTFKGESINFFHYVYNSIPAN
ncbi:MAG TPA: transglutaminase-like domain-containing protein, partial [Puia sp.]|nr:transglutaminase-like domain-containing protein [Puia sp.]